MTTLDLITEATGFLASLIAFILFPPPRPAARGR